LPADERHKIIEEATTKSKLPKFKPLQLAMAKNKGGKDKDSELLKEDANLHAQIRSIEARHRRYDLHTPFTIVFPEDCKNSPRLATHAVYHRGSGRLCQFAAIDYRWADHTQCGSFPHLPIGHALPGRHFERLVQYMDGSSPTTVAP
jgi:hypothetical protein